jgi:hypothetical protein
LPIDLGNDGVTPNDGSDGQYQGPNGSQNFPVITGISVSGATTTVTGTLDSSANSNFTIDLYGAEAVNANPDGHGQCDYYLGTSSTVTTDGTGHATWTATIADTRGVTVCVTATNTDQGWTSEVSQNYALTTNLKLSSTAVSVGENAGPAVVTVQREGTSSGTIGATFATANGTATAPSDYTSQSGSLSWAAGDRANKTVCVAIVNDTTKEDSESFTVAMSPSGSFNGSSTATVTITDDDPTPTIQASSASVAEGNSGNTTLTFPVSLTNPSSKVITVPYTVTDVSATKGTDYTMANGTLTFNAGSTTATAALSATVLGDVLYEPNETFTVSFGTPVNATVSPATVTGTITNDDATPVLTINDVTQAEGNSGTSNAVFTVTLTGATGVVTTVHYATSDGTATAGSDYTATSGDLTFATGAGPQTKTITVPIAGDTVAEPNETYTVTLSSAVNATLGDATGAGTITNDDPYIPVNVSLTPTSGTSASGTARTITTVTSDGDGSSDISTVRILVNTSVSTVNAIYGTYDVVNNKLYLFNDGGTALLGGFAPGSANTISNSQGSLNCAATTVSSSGNMVTVNWNLTPTPAFVGAKNLYQYATDKEGNAAAWLNQGTWTITAANVAPTVTSVTPSSGTSAPGTARQLSAVYSDGNGASDIASARLIVGTSITYSHTLYGYYDKTVNKLYMYDDTGSTRAGGYTPGSANVITNSQGTLNCAATTVTSSGNNLTINWNFTPSASFTGTKILYLVAADTAGTNSGWQTPGT